MAARIGIGADGEELELARPLGGKTPYGFQKLVKGDSHATFDQMHLKDLLRGFTYGR